MGVLTWLILSCNKTINMTPATNTIPVSGTAYSTATSADLIAGQYTGTGKRLVPDRYLGTSAGCVIMTGWERNFETGAARLTISKIDSNAVILLFKGGPFSDTDTYVRVISKTGNTIRFHSSAVFPGEELSFDVNTKVLTVVIFPRPFYHVPTPSCTGGLPYYYGIPDVTGANHTYFTMAHIDFSTSQLSH